MNFIVQLPISDSYDAIYVCVNRFTKMAHFCPTNSTITVEGTVSLYLKHMFKNHGLLDDIESWYPIHFEVHTAITEVVRCHREQEHLVPSPVRWADREDEPDLGTVPAD